MVLQLVAGTAFSGPAGIEPEALDPKVRGARDIRDLLSVSPLVAIPSIRNSRSRRRNMWRFVTASASGVIGVWVVFTVILNYL